MLHRTFSCCSAQRVICLWQHQRALCTNSHKPLPLLTFFTKKNESCSLCDVAKDVLAKYSTMFSYEEVYIDAPGYEEWFDKYRYDIPVLHLNGHYLMKHRINERLLLKKLKEHATSHVT